ncbi:unnamed protein product [Caenorhabditis nigoni]
MFATPCSWFYINKRSDAYCNHALKPVAVATWQLPIRRLTLQTVSWCVPDLLRAFLPARSSSTLLRKQSSYLSKDECYAGSVYSRLLVDRRDILLGDLQLLSDVPGAFDVILVSR